MAIDVSQKVWEFAELGLMEERSSELIASTLERHGFSVKRGVAGMPTAFTATYGSGHPVIGLMGEYDALPGISQKVSPKKEPIVEEGPGHGCGHNIHGASAMAAAIAVREAIEKDGIKGTVRFYGCPAEENYSGKVFMVREGLFNDVDVALSHHPGWFNAATLESSLAVNSVKFHFYGVSSHAAASPHLGKSALDAVELMNAGVNFMREHVVQEARIHYVIEKGGQQPNVVPPYARTWYYVRAPERSQVDQIYDWILKIADGADLMARTTHKVEFLEGTYNVLPNRELSELVVSNMRTIGSPSYTKEELDFAKTLMKTVPKEDKIAGLRQSKRPGWENLVDVLMDDTIPDPWNEGEVMPGSTDVADVSWVTPTLEFTTATVPIGVPGHSWQFVAVCGMGLGHKSLIFAAKTLAASALDLMTDPTLLEKVRAEFDRRKAGRKYKCAIPSNVKPPLEVAREAAGAS
ncbi:MAG: amidohydrolase [Candidatus Thorarchaeota archaeon]|nr:MAG: amidohydrolase [Candidatus Thorarchaeota archaeon]RLI58346.1 MAG: amidohydrolase [Candidatus Thorarchaeota archaeon]